MSGKKILSYREKKRRYLLKRYKSIENKLHGENKVWWHSISLSARYSFVFGYLMWKKYNTEKEFKDYLKSHKISYRTSIVNVRTAKIDLINDII